MVWLRGRGVQLDHVDRIRLRRLVLRRLQWSRIAGIEVAPFTIWAAPASFLRPRVLPRHQVIGLRRQHGLARPGRRARLHHLPLKAFLQHADLPELHHRRAGTVPARPMPRTAKATWTSSSEFPPAATRRARDSRPVASPLVGRHGRVSHWKFGTMTVPWPDCCTDPEKVPSAAMVKLPAQDDDPGARRRRGEAAAVGGDGHTGKYRARSPWPATDRSDSPTGACARSGA